MTQKNIFKDIVDSIVNLDDNKAIELANKAINQKFDILEIIEQGFGEGIRRVGELWDKGDFFLPELMMAAKIMQNCLDLLTPHLQGGKERKTLGKVVVATIEGDIHSIGKNIVASLLRAYGFEVYDLGVDVPLENIINEAIKKNADIIGLSALLTSTMIGQKKFIQILKQKKLDKKFKIMLGGAPITKKWVEECGADGYAGNAFEAVELARSLLKK